MPPTRASLPGASGITAVVWATLLVSIAARFALAFGHSMAWWGLDLLRFVAAPAGWVVTVLAALALVPPLARRLAAPLARISEWRLAAPSFAAAAALLAFVLPDRSRFVGDFALREIASHTAASDLANLYPQGFPLDALIHDRWMRAAAAATPVGIAEWGRVLGALEAALLALLAVRLARGLDARGPWAVAIATIVATGGLLALFTGYNKAFAELTLITVAVGVFGLEIARGGSALVPLSLCVAAAILLHRLGLALLPAWAVALAIGWRPPRHGFAFAAAVALPIAAIAIVFPHLRGAAAVDVGNFLPGAARREGVWAAAFAGRHLLDLGNAILMLAPLAPLAPLAMLAPNAGRARPRSEWILLGALALPLVAFAPFYHPPQGVFRDWDALAPTAAALAVVAAWSLAGTVARIPTSSWLAVPVALIALAPGIQLLLLHHDLGAAIERARRFAVESPPRLEHERATVWDWIGGRYLEIGLADSASASFARAASLTPSPRILREWAATEIVRGRPDAAASIYRRLLARKPDDVAALLEYAMLSYRAGDRSSARAAAQRVLTLAPEQRRARALLAEIESTGAAPADSTPR